MAPRTYGVLGSGRDPPSLAGELPSPRPKRTARVETPDSVLTILAQLGFRLVSLQHRPPGGTCTGYGQATLRLEWYPAIGRVLLEVEGEHYRKI